MNKLPLFAIEGAAFAGKTTLLNELERKFPGEFILIPEASEFVGGDKNFPDVPFKTLDDAKASTHFFLELEKQRLKYAQKEFLKQDKPILLDRTTPISSLIFYSLLKFTNPENKNFIEEFYQHAISAFNIEAHNGDLLIPSHLIYVHPASEEVFVNRFSRGTKNGVFASLESLHFLDEKYHKLLESYYTGKHLIVYSENNSKNLKENADKITNFLKQNDGGLLTNVFDNFLNENVLPQPIAIEKEFVKYSKAIEHCRSLIKTTQKNE